MKRFLRFFGFDTLVLTVWILAFAVYQMQALSDPDTPWHLATGTYILSHHMVPTTDVFSWTMTGKPWVTQEWLFEVAVAWLAAHLQFAGLWLLISVIHTLTVLTLYWISMQITRGNRVVSALAACTGTLAGLVFWVVRPQIFSYFMFAVFLLILEQVRCGRLRVLFLVPVLMFVWANTHGSSTIGILMLILEVLISFVPPIGRFERLWLPKGARWSLLAAACGGVAAGFLNPNGIKAYTYALLSANPTMTNNIMEWHSPDFHSDYFKYGVLGFLVVCFLILLLLERRLPLRETLYFGGAFAATLIYQRFMPYLAIASVPLIASMLRDTARQLASLWRWVRLLCLGAVVLVVAVFTTDLPRVKGSVDAHFDKQAYPIAAVNYLLAQHLKGPVLNAYHWGGYLIYRGVPTFVDGRTDIFLQSSVFVDYLAIRNVWWNAPDLVDQYKFNVALFPSGDPIVTYLSNDPAWHVAYRDDNAVILVRNKPV